MRKIAKLYKPLICFALCIALIISFFCLAFRGTENEKDNSEQAVLTIWQVDSFEGGKGSRADFLQRIGKDFTDNTGIYVTVVTITSEALRYNLAEGNAPDLISYGAGTYGIESYITGYANWCSGGYCILTLDSASDFSDISVENTIINSGKDNLSSVAALFCGLQGAQYEKPTGAYVKLINEDYKYLLGTQRDIYRLKTRGVVFAIKPVTQFNDLYQNISVVSGSVHSEYSHKFIDYLLTRTGEVDKLGLLSDKVVYEDEMRQMMGIDYEYRLTSPISGDTKQSVDNFIASGDINMLKNLFK